MQLIFCVMLCTRAAHHAHYMPKREFDTLIENIKRDGCLTSYPVVYDFDVPGEILSGNHRVEAAKKAGIESTHCIVIKSQISKDRKTSIILSHNAIKGADDESILKALYDSIEDIDLKRLSGLSDDDFKLEEAEFTPLNFDMPKAQAVTLMFLPEDKEAFTKAAENLKKNVDYCFAHNSEFDVFYETVIKVKREYGIFNISTALKLLCELAQKQIEQEQQNSEQEPETDEN